MPGRYMHPNWTPAVTLPVIVPAAIAISYALYILAYPPSTSRRRKLSILLLFIPTFTAFRYCDHIAPSYDLVDTFARACIIWFAHMSYEVCILEYTPDVRPGPGETKERIKQAYKVFFDRSHTQIVEQQKQQQEQYRSGTRAVYKKNAKQHHGDATTDKKTDEPIKAAPVENPQHVPHASYQHGLSRWQLIRYHVLKALAMYALQFLWEFYEAFISPFKRDPDAFATADMIPFFSRLPQSLHYREVYWRTEEAFNWNVPTKWLYEGYHSIFAVLHVGLGIDGPEEWGLGLFGELKEAWSVRRYWKYYWHNYIYHSFVGHVKCVTRGWLGMRRGTATRLIENTLVFFLSGLMHTAVRWQEAPWTDLWAVTIMYTSQIIPLVIEAVVIHYWRQVRSMLRISPDAKWVNRAEYAIGYFWVFAWQFYSISTYWLVRDKWTDEVMEKAFKEKYANMGVNETSSQVGVEGPAFERD
jgi:hypothetical protein